MSKRLRTRSNSESKENTNETNSIYIPQVKINYGGYGQTLDIVNIENDEEGDTVIGGTVGLINDEQVGFQEDEYDMYGNDWNVEELTSLNLNVVDEDENEFYEEPTFSDEIFNDSSLFQRGLLISKDRYESSIEEEINLPLFEGSSFSLKEFCRYMLMLKTNQNLGDVTFTIIVGSILSFLPDRNGFRKYIDVEPSMYNIKTTILKLSNITDVCRVFKFKVCDLGTCVISKMNCLDHGKPCIHSKLTNQYFHYFPVRDRIWKLLHSDARNLLHAHDFLVRPDNYDEVCVRSFTMSISPYLLSCTTFNIKFISL